MSGPATDTLFITCHLCGREMGKRTVPCGEVLTADRAIKMHEAMVRHLKSKHL